jgi:hypothetical protein
MKHFRAKTIATTSIAAGGAALMFFFDPSRSKKRRTLVRDKAAKFARHGASSLAKAGRDLSHRTHGVIAETRSRVFCVSSSDEVVLSERIRSKLGRLTSYPIVIEVSMTGGDATLRGDVLESELDPLLSGIRDVPGVRKVRNELRAHKTTEGVPGLQGSQRNSGDSRVLQTWTTPGARMFVGLAGSALTLYGARKRGALAKLAGTVGIGLLGGELASIATTKRIQESQPGNTTSKIPASPQSIEQEPFEIAAKHEEWK